MTINQWHVITHGFVLVTSKTARLYFFCFHFICATVILNIFSAFVIEAFILEFSVTSASSVVDGGRKPQSTALMERIYNMGLAYGKSEAVKAAVNPTAGDLQELVPEEQEEDFIDADHEKTMELPRKNVEENNVFYANHSSRTGIRFVLTSRTRTVMGLLEKMFET